ncbi:hypothetical protein RB195_010610 [Necator americanus]|uniref:Uncharacterized protein n=2 Tax=Necator americanus TaxID=51031 RepID=W2THM1_NECAM|nr:hypothetical protein NECAME_09041 [Necator americanus]ETN80681.1 hypothetical protein NECAME_09041 [Necator americanus]
MCNTLLIGEPVAVSSNSGLTSKLPSSIPTETMSERYHQQQMEKIKQLSDLKMQLQMAATEAAAAKAEAEKARQQLDNFLKQRESDVEEKSTDDSSRRNK